MTVLLFPEDNEFIHICLFVFITNQLTNFLKSDFFRQLFTKPQDKRLQIFIQDK